MAADAVDATRTTPTLGWEIATSGWRVFARNERRADLFEERWLQVWLDTNHMRRVQNHYLYGDPSVIPGTVEASLHTLDDAATRLRRLRASDARPRTDEDMRWLVERGLLLGCEAVLNAGNHVLCAGFRRPSESYDHILAGLVAEGVIAPELRDLVELRHVLVHGFGDDETEPLWRALTWAPEGFERFADEMRAWLHAVAGPARDPR